MQQTVVVKCLIVITGSLAGSRNRLYEAYVSPHAGDGGHEAVGLVCRRDTGQLFPPPMAGPLDELVEQGFHLLDKKGVTSTIADATAGPARGEHAIRHRLATILERVA